MTSTQQQTGAAATLASRGTWDKGAAGWNHNSRFIRDWLSEVTSAMLDAACIGPGSRVLDIAAGAGDQTIDIAQRVGSHGYVLATDISARSVELMQTNVQTANFRNVEARVADAQALGLAGADFDAVVCRLGLMFCRSPLAALREARAALRPGGRLSAVVFSHPRNNPCVAISMAVARKHAALPAPSASTPVEPGTLFSLGESGLLASLLTAAGFTNIDVRPVDAPHRLRSVTHYVDFVRRSATPIIELLSSLTQKAQDAAWEDLEQQLDVFTTPTGWVGPNELLLCAATSPIELPGAVSRQGVQATA